MVLSYFLTHFDSDSKSAFILIFAPLYVMPFFLLVVKSWRHAVFSMGKQVHSCDTETLSPLYIGGVGCRGDGGIAIWKKKYVFGVNQT